jgi:hypothetical protein
MIDYEFPSTAINGKFRCICTVWKGTDAVAEKMGYGASSYESSMKAAKHAAAKLALDGMVLCDLPLVPVQHERKLPKVVYLVDNDFIDQLESIKDAWKIFVFSNAPAATMPHTMHGRTLVSAPDGTKECLEHLMTWTAAELCSENGKENIRFVIFSRSRLTMKLILSREFSCITYI